MGAKIEVWLDEDRRFIRQRIDGQLDVEDFQRLDEETQKLAADLRDPQAVLILFDARRFGVTTRRARRAMLRTLERPTLRRIAGYGAGGLGRVMAHFMVVMSGLDKLRMFLTETEAIQWLLS